MPLAQTYQEARTQVERLAERFARSRHAYGWPHDLTAEEIAIVEEQTQT